MIFEIFILVFLKLIFLKLLKINNFDDFRSHILSFIISLLILFIFLIYKNYDYEKIIFIFFSSILFSYSLINFPGAYATSLTIRIIEKIKSGEIKKYKSSLEYELLKDRLQRLFNQKIIYRRNNQIFIKSKKLNIILFILKKFKYLIRT